MRELREELGIEAQVAGEPLAHVQGRDHRMEVFLATGWRGEPALQGDEHDDLAWLGPEDLAGRPLVDARLPALLVAARAGRRSGR